MSEGQQHKVRPGRQFGNLKSYDEIDWDAVREVVRKMAQGEKYNRQFNIAAHKKKIANDEEKLIPTEEEVSITDEIVDDQQQEITNDDIILYHISSAPNIEVLDPMVAVQRPSRYSRAEYRAWDRPRVFFFTELGQKDIGVGRIKGTPYRVRIGPNDVYPVYEDPLKFGSREEEYKEIREQERGIKKYSPANYFEIIAFFAERELGAKGFIYPQGGNVDNMIVALWEAVPAEKMDEPFYQ